MTSISINKIGVAVDVDFGALPEVSQQFIINYGLRQVLNDAHASIQLRDFPEGEGFKDAVENAVNTRLGALVSGDLTTKRGGGLPVDPVQREVIRMAREEVRAAIKAQGRKLSTIENLDDIIAAHAEKASERLVKEAKKRLAVIASAPAPDVDLSALGL
jgi:hypothetical protein